MIAPILIVIASIATTFVLARGHALRGGVVSLPIDALIGLAGALVVIVSTVLIAEAITPRALAALSLGVTLAAVSYYVASVVVQHYQRRRHALRSADVAEPPPNGLPAPIGIPFPAIEKKLRADPGVPPIASLADFDHVLETVEHVTNEIDRRGKFDPPSFDEADHAATHLRTLLMFARYCREQAMSMMRPPGSKPPTAPQGGLVS